MSVWNGKDLELEVSRGRFRYLFICFCLVTLALLFCVGGRGDIELSRGECSGRVVAKEAFGYSTSTRKQAVVVVVDGNDGNRCIFSVARNRGEKFYLEGKAAMADFRKNDRVQASCVRSNYAKACEIVRLEKEGVIVLEREESEAVDVVKRESKESKRLKDFLTPLFVLLTALEVWLLRSRSKRQRGRWRDN